MSKTKGITLVELIIAMGMMLVIIASAVRLLQNTGFFFQGTMSKAQMRTQLRDAFSTMTQKIQAANPTSVTMYYDSTTATYNKILFKTCKTGSAAATQYEFYLAPDPITNSRNQLLMRVNDTQITILATKVQRLKFSYPNFADISSIGVHLSLDNAGPGNRVIRLQSEDVVVASACGGA